MHLACSPLFALAVIALGCTPMHLASSPLNFDASNRTQVRANRCGPKSLWIMKVHLAGSVVQITLGRQILEGATLTSDANLSGVTG